MCAPNRIALKSYTATRASSSTVVPADAAAWSAIGALTSSNALILIGSSVAAGIAGGAVSGFIGSGGSWAAARAGAIAGGISGLIGGWTGAIGLASGSIPKIVAHGFGGGFSNMVHGGKFGEGFLSGAFTEKFAPQIDGIDKKYNDIQAVAKRTVAAAVAGGTAAEIGGGKFANGARTAAFARLFNHEVSELSEDNTLKHNADYLLKNPDEIYFTDNDARSMFSIIWPSRGLPGAISLEDRAIAQSLFLDLRAQTRNIGVFEDLYMTYISGVSRMSRGIDALRSWATKHGRRVPVNEFSGLHKGSVNNASYRLGHGYDHRLSIGVWVGLPDH